MTQASLIIAPWATQPIQAAEGQTGCYCVPLKDWCPKFTGFHNDFWRECCQHCHVKLETDALADARFKKWKEEKEEREKHPRFKRDWTHAVPDGNIGAKAYE